MTIVTATAMAATATAAFTAITAAGVLIMLFFLAHSSDQLLSLKLIHWVGDHLHLLKDVHSALHNLKNMQAVVSTFCTPFQSGNDNDSSHSDSSHCDPSVPPNEVLDHHEGRNDDEEEGPPQKRQKTE